MTKQNTHFSFVTEINGDVEKMTRSREEGDMYLIPLRDNVLFPATVTPITVGRSFSLKALKQAEKSGDTVAVFCQKEPDKEIPLMEDLYRIGVAAKVIHTIKGPDGTYNVLLQAMNRIGLDEVRFENRLLKARVSAIPEQKTPHTNVEFSVTLDLIKERIQLLNSLSEEIPSEVTNVIEKMPDNIFLVNFLATNLGIPPQEKIRLLGLDTDMDRATQLLFMIKEQVQLTKLKHDIEMKTQADLNRQQREYFVSQEIKNLQAELGNSDENTNKFDDMQNLRAEASKKNWDASVAETFEKELSKLSRINAQSPDYNVQLNYLQTLLQLPWNDYTTDNLDLKRADRILNADHYGMEKVKERILEHLAVLSLKRDKKSPILCLYGPPGVGKTSLGRSIAKALNRKYVRISLGGMHDESEIRGHRRTYIGAMPGRIIKNIIKAGSSNPVFILDEIDKVTQQTVNGDPSSALLEVLDPEQNKAFHDNFLDMDYDLSNVMFIATANDINSIPRPLLDRMELIEVGGYITEEKIEIARKHLFPKEKENNGLLDLKKLKLNKAATEMIIERYTRESGVRSLNKQINRLLRKVALNAARGESMESIDHTLTNQDVQELLGTPPFSRDIYQGNDYAGVVTGLAWTSVGGEILFIETSLSEGKGNKLTITGNLGDVMKESAILALEYIKAHARELNIDMRIFDNYNIHIHVPEGAVPKDGPSAGITMATSLASALTQRKVRSHIAMTGEITLRGKVLPVGGIREKILAAKRAGIKTIILCQDNRKDIEDIPEMYLNDISFEYVETISDVWKLALLKNQVSNPITFNLDTEKANA